MILLNGLLLIHFFALISEGEAVLGGCHDYVFQTQTIHGTELTKLHWDGLKGYIGMVSGFEANATLASLLFGMDSFFLSYNTDDHSCHEWGQG